MTNTDRLFNHEQGEELVRAVSGIAAAMGGDININAEISELQDITSITPEITTKSYAPIITVDDALGVNAVDVKVKVEPVQAGSGTPSPSNVRAISGWSSVGIYNAKKNLLNATNSSESFPSGSVNTKILGTVFCKAGKQYTFSANQNTALSSIKRNTLMITKGSISIYESTSDNYHLSAGRHTMTFTPSVDGVYYFKIWVHTPNVNCTYSQFQVEEGSTATDYEPYQGKDYFINLGGTYYGGEIDVTSGVMKVDRVYVKKTWGEYITIDSLTNVTRKYLTVTSYGLGKENPTKQLCNIAPYEVNYSADRVHFYVASTSNYSNIYMYLPTDTPSSTEIEVVYELATPYYINLTPTDIQLLQNQNALFADSGDIYLEYRPNGIGNIGETLGEVQTDLDGVVENELQMGAVNLLPNTAESIVSRGITFTVNDDGTVTTNGTCTQTTYFFTFAATGADEYAKSFGKFAGKKVKLTGCPLGGSESLYDVRIEGDSQSIAYTDYGQGIEFTLPETISSSIAIIICIRNTVTVSNLVFKPMLTLASQPNSDYAHYVPYAKSNKELTDDFKVIEYTSITGVTAIKSGHIVEVLIEGTFTINHNQLTLIGTLPNDMKPKHQTIGIVSTNDASINLVQAKVKTNGDIEINGWQLSGELNLYGSLVLITK